MSILSNFSTKHKFIKSCNITKHTYYPLHNHYSNKVIHLVLNINMYFYCIPFIRFFHMSFVGIKR